MANGCISVERILSKLDEHLGRNDYAAAERHLCYWLSEAESGGDGRTELLVRNELMGLYRKTGRKDEALASAEAALAAISRMGIDEQVGAATTYLNSATVYKAFGMAGDGSEFLILDDGTIALNGSEGYTGRIADSMKEFFALLLNFPCFWDFMVHNIYLEENKELFL